MNLLPTLPTGAISTRRLILAALGVGALVLGLCTWSCAAERRAKAHTAKADTHQTARVVAAAEGAVYDQTAQAQAKDTQAAAAASRAAMERVAEVRQRVERWDAAGSGSGAAGVAHAGPSGVHASGYPAAVVDELNARIADQAALIEAQNEALQAQDHEIGGLKAEVATLTRARDAWRRSAEEGGREALQLRAALAAREGSLRAERWRGRIEGLAVGVALGYGAGRMQ